MRTATWNVAVITGFLEMLLASPPPMSAGDELMLADFEAGSPLRVIEGRSKVTLVAEHATQGRQAGKVAPGFMIVCGGWTGLPADWSGYDELRLDVFNPGKPEAVSLWISDGNTEYYQRHNNALPLREGANTLVVPVGGLWRGEKGSGKFLDPKRIQQLVIIFPKQGADAYYLDNFRMVKGAGKARESLLLGFEEGEASAAKWSVEDWPEDQPGKSKVTIVAEHATQGERALRFDFRPAGAAMVLRQVPADWSGYDTLLIDCFSTAPGPVKLGGWVRDEVSKDGDYWQRHNYQMNVRPGASTIEFPVGGLWRGEKGSGKFLDLHRIDSLCITCKGATLYLDNIRLAKSGDDAAVAGMRKFDFGPHGSPTFPGFTAVFPDSTYTKERGFGWVGRAPSDARNHEQPDSLQCDFVIADDGTRFAVDVPDGEYVTHLAMDVPGFWDYPAWKERIVESSGKQVIRQVLTDAQFLKDYYFRYQDTEDLPGCDIWQRYVGDRYKPRSFTVTATGGKIELTFKGDRWALTPAWMVIYPASQAELGSKYLRQLEVRRKQSFYNAYAETVRPADAKPQISPEEQKAGFVLFGRPVDQAVYYNSAPGAVPEDTRTVAADLAACPGEYESFDFDIYPLRDCGELTVTAGDLLSAGGKRIPASAMRVRGIRYKFTRIGGRITSSFGYEPWLLVDLKSWPIVKDVTRRFWVTLKVPADAAAGTYAGKLTISVGGVPREIPLRLEVYPFMLDEPKMSIGMYGGQRPTGGGGWPESLRKEFRVDERLEEVLRDQKEHGMTAITPVAPSLRSLKGGRAEFDYVAADKCMQLLRELGYRHECFTYASMFRVHEGDLEKECRERFGMPLKKAVALAYEELGRHAKQANWLPVAWALADEPLIHGISPQTVMSVFQAHRNAAQQMQFVIEDAMGEESHWVVIPAVDIVCANTPRYKVAQAVKNHKARYWFNNIGTDRFTFGWFLWKAHQEMNVEALFQWGYSTNHADIYYDLDGFEGDSGVSFTASEGQRPRTAWEMIREGADDHRYLQTLENLIARAEASGRDDARTRAAEARRFCQEVMGRIDLEAKTKRPYSQADLEKHKRALASRIMGLRQAIQ